MMRAHMLIDGLGVGGAEMLLGELAAVAPAAGIELSVGFLSGRAGGQAIPRLRAHGVEPVEIGIAKLSPRSLLRVRRHIARFDPDVVHTHLQGSDVLGPPAARSLGVPVVSTLHTMVWDFGGRDGIKETIAIRMRRHLVARVIAVSEFARERYLAEGRDRPQHVSVVRNGVRGERTPGAGASVRAQLGIAPGELVVALLATLRPEKAHDVAAQAIALLRGGGLPARLLVVGDGPGREEVRRAAAAAGPDAVVLAGFRDDVMQVLDAADVLVHAPHYDALPTSLIEAAAAGIPAVGTRVGGIPEIVEDGVTGTLVAPPPEPRALAAALEPLLADRELRLRMGEAARERFEREFSAESWARRLRALYEEVRSA